MANNRLLTDLNLEPGNVVSSGLELQTKDCTAAGFQLKLVFFDSGETVISSFLGNVVDPHDSTSDNLWQRSVKNNVGIPNNAVYLNIGFVYTSLSVANETVGSRKPTLNRGVKVAPFTRPSNTAGSGGSGSTPRFTDHTGLRNHVIGEARLVFVKGLPAYEWDSTSTESDNGWTVIKPATFLTTDPGRWKITRPNTFEYDSSWDENWVDDYVIDGGDTEGPIDHSNNTGTDMSAVIQAQIDYLSDLVKQDPFWVENTDISFTAPDKINSAGSEFGSFSVGNTIGTFGSVANNFSATITAVTAAQITVDTTFPGRPLTTESAGPEVRITRLLADETTGRRQFVRLVIPHQAKIANTVYVKSGVQIHTSEVLYSHVEDAGEQNDTYAWAFVFMSGSHIDQFKLWGRGNSGILLGTERILNDMKIGNIRLFNIGETYVSETQSHIGVRFQGFNFEYNHIQVDGGNLGFDYKAVSDVRAVAALSVTASTAFRITDGCEQLDLGAQVADSPNFLGVQIDSSGNLKGNFRMFFNEDSFPSEGCFESGYAAKVGIFSTADPVANCDLTFQIANTHARIGTDPEYGGNSVGVLFGAIEDSSTVIIMANESLHTTQTLHTEYAAEADPTFTISSPNLQVTNDIRIHGSGSVYGGTSGGAGTGDLDDMWLGIRPPGVGYLRETEGQTTYQGVDIGGGGIGGGGGFSNVTYILDNTNSIGWYRVAQAPTNFGEGSFEISVSYKTDAIPPGATPVLQNAWSGVGDDDTFQVTAVYNYPASADVARCYAIPADFATLTAAASKNDTTLSLTSVTGLAVDDYMTVTEKGESSSHKVTAIDTLDVDIIPGINFDATTSAGVFEEAAIGSHVAEATVVRGDSNRRNKFSFSGLTAKTRYYYKIFQEGVGEDAAVFTGFSKTMEIANTARSFTFFGGSCAAWSNSNTFISMAKTLDALSDVDFFIHTGDLAYLDTWSSIDTARENYDVAIGDDRQRLIWKTYPAAYMFDDHDMGTNDGYKGSATVTWAHDSFRENCPNIPETGSGSPYYSFINGRVRFIMCDNRSERDIKTAIDNSSKLVYSAAQRTWLMAELDAAADASQIVVWMHSYPFISDVSTGIGSDNWRKYSTYREALVDDFQIRGTGGTTDMTLSMLSLGGDAHMMAWSNGVGYGAGSSGAFPSVQAASYHSGGSLKGGPWSDMPTTDEGGYSWPDGAVVGERHYGVFTVTDSGGATISIRFKGYARPDLTLNDPDTEYLSIDETFVITVP